LKREIKTTLALDGEKEFKKGLEDAQRQMRVLASESKAVTSAFGANQKSVEALTAKNRVLTQQIDQQEEIVKALKRAVKESAQMYGEADAKTDAWRIKLNKGKRPDVWRGGCKNRRMAHKAQQCRSRAEQNAERAR